MAAQYTPELDILYNDLALIALYAEAGSADGGEGEMASSCPSSWLKEVNLLSPLPTDTTRRCPSEAGGEGRMLRGWVEGAPTGAGEAGVDSDSDCWAAEAAAW